MNYNSKYLAFNQPLIVIVYPNKHVWTKEEVFS